MSGSRTSEPLTVTQAAQVFANPAAYADEAYFHAATALLRQSRMEITALLTELLPRLESLELDGEPELSASVFVSGLKRLPLRYRLR